ncbi:MAG: LysM peptidoglycan-binding domain-containing protein, partial [Anaerolineales bacterium]|nr:LysM peptidoglycan-binding domain-containing protein [Anaerolineales bacterium]
TRYPHQNPTSGGGPIQEVRKVVQGDRLDLIAADVYGDATQWRHIAAYNRIRNPKSLRPGQLITIPPLL